MNKKFALGVLFVLAIAASAVFNIMVSAEKGGRTPEAPQLSTTIVISQVFGGGGGTTGTYKNDYVELFNISGSPQSLDGLSLQYGSATGQFGSSAGNIAALPTGVTIQPGQYFLVQLGTAGTGGADLPVTPDFVSPNITASGTNGKIALTNGLPPNSCGATATPCALPNAQIIDLVSYGVSNNAEGGATAGNGTSLTSTQGAVRNGGGCMETDNNAADFTIVTAPVPRNTASPRNPCGNATPTPTLTPTPTPTPTPTLTPTPTPTPAPPATPGVVINEIYGGGGNSGATFNQDYVELYNNSSASVDISNYSLQYASATGVTATSFAVCTISSTDTIIEPGTYFLIATGPISAAVGTAPPAANAVCPVGINLSSTAGKLALVNGTTQLNATTCPPTGATIVDFVGYGATASCSETAPAPAPSNTMSIQRTPVGTDTNNNAADFTVQATPSPTRAATGTPPRAQKNVDFDGDNTSDYVVTRSTNSQKFWYINNATSAFTSVQFGLSTDIETPADFDGDNKTDIAVWRGNGDNPDLAYFFILNSATMTVRIEQFGRQGDDPRVVADYDGDLKADVAVYRTAADGGQNFFFYRGSLTGGSGFTSVAFGAGRTTRPNVGDYDGDGRADFCVHYDSNGQGVFAVRLNATGAVDFTPWGLVTDALAPGDYDGDGKADFAVVRNQNGQLAWYILERDGGGTGGSPINWGVQGDTITPGDYDGDNRQDVAVWRGTSTDPATQFFYIRRSSNSALQSFEWGDSGDYPAANWYVHRGNLSF